MKFTVNQKKLLNLLLDKYEGSKTYKGTNLLQQNFAVEPTSVWEEYSSDYASVEQVRDFENEMQYLQDMELVTLQKKTGVISKILACSNKWAEYYTILQRKAKVDIVQEQLAFFEEWKNKNVPVIMPFCEEQLERIGGDKKPTYDLETAEALFRIIEFIRSNSDDLLERELSIILFSDSKTFEKKYRSKVCKLIQTYMDFSDRLQGVDEPREVEKVILEEFNVYANPSYIYLKGRARLLFKDGREFALGSSPIAISSELLKGIASITVETDRIVTVENLTSFHRIYEENCVYIFLSGYHNSAKQALLKRISKENSNKEWFHFGDIDPDGFYILEHLKRETGISFHPLSMGIGELEKYSKYCKALNQNDRVKAENLIKGGKYPEVLCYMLDRNCKLEQEIVSVSGKISGSRSTWGRILDE